MKLRRLQLRDYRGFHALDLEFSPEVTALVGVNAAGKTTILEALALLFRQLTEGIRGKGSRSTPDPSDIRVGASSTVLSMEAEVDDENVAWSVAQSRAGHPVAVADDLEGLRPLIERAQRGIVQSAPRLPLAVYFPADRNALDIPDRIRTPTEFDALSAYDGALDAGGRNFRAFFEWFRDEEDAYNEQELLKRQPSLPIGDAGVRSASPLAHVKNAILSLTGASDVRIERRPRQRMILTIGGTRLDVAQLSDGQRVLLALAGDLARRMALAAPTLTDPLAHDVVVLIDEIELHLHPGLQRKIVPLLQTTFPRTQFVVTTHSPQVLSSLRAGQVRVLDQFAVRALDGGTWQRDTNRILESAFGDPGRPLAVATDFARLREAIDNDAFDEARELLAKLRSSIEGEDPEIVFYEQLVPPAEH
jgi:predicted ATP-binding protein involved in virulence